MTIKIGDRNKIKKSIIVNGNENIPRDNTSTIKTIIITIVATVVAGIIMIAIEYYFNVLGIF